MNEEELIDDIEQTIKDIEAGETDYTIFDVATDIENISNDKVRFNVMLHFIEQLSYVPAAIDNILYRASKEQIEASIGVLKENNINLDELGIETKIEEDKSMGENLKDTVIGKIAMSSLTNPKRDNLSVEDAEKRIEELGNAENISSLITYDSEVAAIRGMATVLGLNEGQVTKLIGTRDEDGKLKRDGQIYTQSVIDSLASYMHGASVSTNEQPFNSQERSIIKMLSVIHNNWVRSNPNKFMQEGRNEEYQFAPLMLLDWEEAKSNLIFLKPILEAGQVDIDEEALKKEFELEQMEFLLENEITTHEELVGRLSFGEYFYSTLRGLETENGGSIEQLLNNPEIAEKMAKQIEDRIEIKSQEELVLDLIKSDNHSLESMMWLKTKSQLSDNVKKQEPSADKMNFVDSAISRREYILSKTIGKPYPKCAIKGYGVNRVTSKDDPNATIHLGEKGYISERYENELINGTKSNSYLNKILEAEIQRKTKVFDAYGVFPELTQVKEKHGKIELPYSKISITKKELLLAGLDPEMMGWEEEKTITPEEIAKADKEQGLTTTEVSGFKKLLNKLKELFRGRGEK